MGASHLKCSGVPAGSALAYISPVLPSATPAAWEESSSFHCNERREASSYDSPRCPIFGETFTWSWEGLCHWVWGYRVVRGYPAETQPFSWEHAQILARCSLCFEVDEMEKGFCFVAPVGFELLLSFSGLWAWVTMPGFHGVPESSLHPSVSPPGMHPRPLLLGLSESRQPVQTVVTLSFNVRPGSCTRDH